MDGDIEGREDCPIIEAHCNYFAYQYDQNDELVISHCSHPKNEPSDEYS